MSDPAGGPASAFEAADASPGLLLWRATLAWQRAMRAALAPHDLTHVQFVLLASAWWLGEHGGPPSQQRLAAHAGTDPMMTSQVVRRLAAAGLLERTPDPADSRARRVAPTPSGRTVLEGALRDVEAADAAYFAPAGADAPALLAALRALGAARHP
ncbi:MAG: MarR family winged helix-turn-helix transcriptional regulator [Nocardioides sp.]